MKQITIGREGTQPFPINDEYVSRHHAIFTYDQATGVMTLSDCSRPEAGTYVRMGNHFQRVSQCNVSPTTDVRLGPYFTFRVGQLFQPPQPPGGHKKPEEKKEEKPEQVDIAYLRRIAEDYEEAKLRLDQQQSENNTYKTFTMVGSLSAAIITPIVTEMMGTNPPLYAKFIGPAVAIVFCASLLIYLGHQGKKIILDKSKNEKNYKIKFCCPKCHVPLTGKLYENLLAEGKCPKCKVKYYDSKI